MAFQQQKYLNLGSTVDVTKAEGKFKHIKIALCFLKLR